MLFASGNSYSQFRVTDVTEQPKPELPKPEQKEQDKFKFQIVYLVPILASLLFGLACAYLLAPQQSEAIPVTPIPETTPGAPFGNALYFVVLIAISATVFYFLLKRKSKNIIKGLIMVALTTASLLLSLVYLSAILPYFPIVDNLWVLIALSVALAVLFDLAIFRFGSIASKRSCRCHRRRIGHLLWLLHPTLQRSHNSWLSSQSTTSSQSTRVPWEKSRLQGLTSCRV